jgi:hypothetical protein
MISPAVGNHLRAWVSHTALRFGGARAADRLWRATGATCPSCAGKAGGWAGSVCADGAGGVGGLDGVTNASYTRNVPQLDAQGR